MKSIMHLVNRESVLVEALELARYGLAQKLEVGVEDIVVSMRVGDQGRIKPEFNVPVTAIGNRTEDGVRKSMALVWLPVKRQMQRRLAGLIVRR